MLLVNLFFRIVVHVILRSSFYLIIVRILFPAGEAAAPLGSHSVTRGGLVDAGQVGLGWDLPYVGTLLTPCSPMPKCFRLHANIRGAGRISGQISSHLPGGSRLARSVPRKFADGVIRQVGQVGERVSQ